MDAKVITNLLSSMARLGASALHLVPERSPALRVHRRLVASDEPPLQASDIDEFVRDLLFSDHREQLALTGCVTVLYLARNGSRYRATVAETGGQTTLVLRPVPELPPQIENLELPPQVAGLTRYRNGLVLVAGFFGSGKSTTLAGMIETLNQDPMRHIVTLEDSIQFVHQNGAALLHQREVGTHVATVAQGLREAIAFGVDVCVVGELRDAEALDAAITAAESGCLVIGGVESGSIVGAITEMTQQVPNEQRPRLRTRLSRVLRGVTAQSLINRSHVDGRVPVVEVLVANGAVRQAIRKGNFHELPAIMKRCRGLGMQTVDAALRQLLAEHVITTGEALMHAANRDEVVVTVRPGR